MSFPPATEMFQFAGFASCSYVFTTRYRLSGGLPHSEIPGSKLTGSSPGLFAACHVLHRLSVPRHPPDALETLDPSSTRRDQKTRPSPRLRRAYAPQRSVRSGFAIMQWTTQNQRQNC